MIAKMTILGILLIVYGGVNHLRKHESARNAILKHLSKANQERFLEFLAPKPGVISIEKAKADLQKIRSYNENCADIDGDKTNCRMADAPQLGNSLTLGSNLDDKSNLGKAANQMKQIEKAKFDEFKKLDSL